MSFVRLVRSSSYVNINVLENTIPSIYSFSTAYTTNSHRLAALFTMSRTFAKLELSVTQNGDTIKTLSQNIESGSGEHDVSTMLSALQKAKEDSNSFLTTLVESGKAHGAEGAVISHSKRKFTDEGIYCARAVAIWIRVSSILSSLSFNFDLMYSR